MYQKESKIEQPMIKRTSVLPLFLFLFIGCSESGSNKNAIDLSGSNSVEPLEKVENEDLYGYIEKYSRRKSDYAKEGLLEKYNQEGILVEKAEYINDTLHGSRIIYSEQGDTQIVETYLMGSFNGPFKAYYENGNIELIGHYRNDTMHGIWKKYYPSGGLMENVTFENNRENGPFVEYYENGKLKAEGEYYKGDNEHGLLRLYNEDGKLIRKMECDKGICKTIWRATER